VSSLYTLNECKNFPLIVKAIQQTINIDIAITMTEASSNADKFVNEQHCTV